MTTGAALAIAGLGAALAAPAGEPARKANNTPPASDSRAPATASAAVEADELEFLEFLGSDDVALELGEYLARTGRREGEDEANENGSDPT